MDQVWIMMKGEDYEGGHIVGVYLDKELAKEDFYREGESIVRFADRIRESWNQETLDVSQSENGALYLHGGCDWLSLNPHNVKARNSVEG